MRFMVRRTSCWDYEIRPCRGAKKAEYVSIDERTVNDPKKLPYPENELWATKGDNHRVEKGRIKRDFLNEAWFIDIQNLEELIKFFNKHGRMIIDVLYDNPDILELEIYDGYRE